MKLLYSAVTIVMFTFLSHTGKLDLEYIRTNYEIAVTDAELCKKMINELSTGQGDLYLGYLGAFQTIWANHTVSPISKLTTFNKGKRNIEKAIKNSPENVELRFVRYSIQKNCPSFLGYRKSLEEDKAFLLRHKAAIKSKKLRLMVDNIL